MIMIACIKRRILNGFLKRYYSLSQIKSLDLISSNKETGGLLDVSYENISKDFKLILDVRSPDEYNTDHLEGAINIPVLNNEERSIVGKVYDKRNPISARILGSSIIMKNMSQYLQQDEILYNYLQERIRSEHDRILVYCWRGGQRSKSMAIILSEIGLIKEPIQVLNGGYRSYRKQVVEDLKKLPHEVTLIGICGLTGTAKTKILKCLQDAGETVLNLEELADHKGSLFGVNVHNICADKDIKITCLSQKAFDSRIWKTLLNICNTPNLRRCNHNKPIVWVECESRIVGNIHLPQSLWNNMQSCKRIIIESSIKERIKHILAEYSFWTDKNHLRATTSVLNWLAKHNHRALVDQWVNMANDGKFEMLVESLLFNHYDPLYCKNQEPFMSCKDIDLVVKMYLESLDTEFIQNNICSKLIDLSKSWFK